MPTCLHFPSQNPPKSHQKSIPRCIKFLIDFCIDFFSILAPSWDPSWGHVGHIFAQNGATEFNPSYFFVESMLLFDVLAVLAPFGLHFGWILEGHPHRPQTLKNYGFAYPSKEQRRQTQKAATGRRHPACKNHTNS